MDLGPPVSYEVLEPGTPVFSSDGHKIGEVVHVLAAENEDIFDGIVISEHHGARGHRFADAEDIDQIHTGGVLLKLDQHASEQLPAPSENPAVMHDDPAETSGEARRMKLKRAWDLMSGNY